MSDFNGEDYDFAAGSIHGMRSWGMDDLGRLHGVTHTEVWTPGENVAACKVERREACPEAAKTKAPEAGKRGGKRCPCGCGMSDHTFLYSFTGHHEYEPCGAPGCREGTHPAAPNHTFDPQCGCGFWAYDEHTFTEHGDVTGIIQGYGKTTVGTRGFRCEKAAIVALSREHKDDLLSLSSWLRLQQLYPAAKFYEETDDMVSKHGAVLRTWPAVGDDFWTRPVKRKSDDGFGWSQYISALSPSLSTPRRWLNGASI